VNVLDRRILRLAVPSILTALSTPLIGIADTAMIGHLPEVAFIGAVSTANLIFTAIFWCLAFLRMGTTALVAQYYGAGDRPACAGILYRSLLLAALFGAVIVAAGPWISRIGFTLAGGSAEVQHWGGQYFAIRVWEAPLALGILTLNGFFFGTANALAPLGVTMVANLVNIGADYALIFGKWGAPEMGVKGAAWASVLGNAAALATGVLLLVYRYRPYLREWPKKIWDLRPMRRLLQTNAFLFGRTLCLQFAGFFMLSMVSRMGEAQLAANAVVLQVWGLASFGIDGFAHAAETLVGNCLGGRLFVEARQMARRIIFWGIGVGVGFAVVYFVALDNLATLFTQHREVVAQVGSLTLFVAVIQPLNAVVFVFDGIFIGANDMGYMFKAMAFAAFAVFVPAALVFVYWLDLGLVGAWMAYNGLMLGRFFTLWPRYRSDAWLRSIIAEKAQGDDPLT
jgi:MATE family multidrug resistance protein